MCPLLPWQAFLRSTRFGSPSSWPPATCTGTRSSVMSSSSRPWCWCPSCRTSVTSPRSRYDLAVPAIAIPSPCYSVAISIHCPTQVGRGRMSTGALSNITFEIFMGHCTCFSVSYTFLDLILIFGLICFNSLYESCFENISIVEYIILPFWNCGDSGNPPS